MKSQQVEKPNGETKNEYIFADSLASVRIVKEAVLEALENYGPGQPRLLWVMGRIKKRELVRQVLAETVPEGITYLFDGSYWHDYGPIGPKAVSSQDQQSILALALGGEVEIQYHLQSVKRMEVGDWALEEHYGEEKGKEMREWEKQRHREWGRSLARQFNVSVPGTRLFFQMGTQHVPRHIWINEGVNEVFAGEEIHIAGGAQADFGWQIHDGKVRENTVYGILIAGDFQVAQAMRGWNKNMTAEKQLAGVIREAKEPLRGPVKLGFYFGCAGWNKSNKAQFETIRQLGIGPVVGRFNGGELGRKNTQSQNEAGADLASIVLIAE